MGTAESRENGIVVSFLTGKQERPCPRGPGIKFKLVSTYHKYSDLILAGPVTKAHLH